MAHRRRGRYLNARSPVPHGPRINRARATCSRSAGTAGASAGAQGWGGPFTRYRGRRRGRRTRYRGVSREGAPSGGMNGAAGGRAEHAAGRGDGSARTGADTSTNTTTVGGAEAMPDAGAAGEGKRAEHGAKRRRERGRTARGSRRGAAPDDDDGNERAAPPAPDFDPGAHRHGPLSRRGSDLHDRDAERHRLLDQVVSDAGTGRRGRGGPSPACRRSGERRCARPTARRASRRRGRRHAPAPCPDTWRAPCRAGRTPRQGRRRACRRRWRRRCCRCWNGPALRWRVCVLRTGRWWPRRRCGSCRSRTGCRKPAV